MKSTQDLIEEELLRLCQQGKIEAFFLFNEEGIPMAEVGQSTHYSHDVLTALAIVFHQTLELIQDFQPDVPIDETSIRTANAFRIVSRPVPLEDMFLILTAIVPHQHSYRKSMNCAVRTICQLMT